MRFVFADSISVGGNLFSPQSCHSIPWRFQTIIMQQHVMNINLPKVQEWRFPSVTFFNISWSLSSCFNLILYHHGGLPEYGLWRESWETYAEISAGRIGEIRKGPWWVWLWMIVFTADFTCFRVWDYRCGGWVPNVAIQDWMYSRGSFITEFVKLSSLFRITSQMERQTRCSSFRGHWKCSSCKEIKLPRDHRLLKLPRLLPILAAGDILL